MVVKNSKEMPKIYYGLHMYPGTAEYREEGKDPYRIYIGEEAIKNMGPTFSGKPVYVRHVNEVNLDKIQTEADGYVVESFFNQMDGKHWAKFIVVSDKGHEAVRNGWKLSNAYLPKQMGSGGLCNGVEFQKEVTQGEYEHLAIVPNPRYDESVILTPEQFKEYNSQKEIELSRLQNSKEQKEEISMFQIFKREKVENSKDAELKGLSVVLPLSKKETTLENALNEYDKILNMHGYASGEHMVKVNDDEEMSVNDLVKKYGEMKKSAMEMEEKKKNEEQDEKKEPDLENKKKNDEKPEPELQNSKDKKDEEKQPYFEMLKNASVAAIPSSPEIDLSQDRVTRGKAKYGSK